MKSSWSLSCIIFKIFEIIECDIHSLRDSYAWKSMMKSSILKIKSFFRTKERLTLFSMFSITFIFCQFKLILYSSITRLRKISFIFIKNAVNSAFNSFSSSVKNFATIFTKISRERTFKICVVFLIYDIYSD